MHSRIFLYWINNIHECMIEKQFRKDPLSDHYQLEFCIILGFESISGKGIGNISYLGEA